MSFIRDWSERRKQREKKVGPPKDYCLLPYREMESTVLVGYYWKGVEEVRE